MNSTERHERRYQRRKAARYAKCRQRLDPYDDFERIANPSALMRANWESRKGVMWKASVARYNANFLKNAIRQSKRLHEGKDIREGFYSFGIIERGKKRAIHSLHYAERVIRRSTCTNAVVPILSNNLIYDNGASLKGRGVSHSINRCVAHLHKFYHETGGNDGYALLIDFKGFFDHILHKPLGDILDKYLLDPRLNALCKGFVAATDAGKPNEGKGMGLYIGPEDSQIYAVAYPNSIDHLIKDQWRFRFYGRYMDDSILICADKKVLEEYKQRLFIEYQKLGIIPNQKKTQIVKLSHGFTYLKTKFFLTESGKVIMKADHDCIVRERRKLKKLHRFYLAGDMTIKQVSQSYMSWRGALLKKDAYRSVDSMDRLFLCLFNAAPWKTKHKKKRRVSHGRNRSQAHQDSRRNYGPQIPVDGQRLRDVQGRGEPYRLHEHHWYRGNAEGVPF